MPRLSIKVKLSAVFSLLVLAFLAYSVGYHPRHLKRQVQDQALRSAQHVAVTTAAAVGPVMGTGDREDITRVLIGVQGLPSFGFSAVFNPKGEMVDATTSAPAWVQTYSKPVDRPVAEIRPDGILVARAPVFVRSVQGDRALEEVGSLVVGFTTEEIDADVRENIQLGLWIGLGALVAGLGTAVFMANAYINPVLQLTSAAQQVAKGNLEGLAVQVRSGDELEDLSRSFEVMTQKLKVSREEIERQNRLLEFRVQERTRQLMETIWELEEVKANLEEMVAERTRGLEQSQEELRAWASTLEDKVKAKTLELTELNESLLASFQQLQAVDRMKDEFLANMSHELRTPLNAVIGFSGLLLQESTERLPEDVREDLRIILHNGRSLLGMIDSILDLSKIEAGRFDLDLEYMDPVPLLQEVRSLAAGLILERPIQFSLEVPREPVHIKGDPVRFKQVITNLVGNAIKFTERGQVVVTAVRTPTQFRVMIRDTGIGMSEGEISRLFRPFQQVDGSITRRFGGTGLGLALSQRLVGMMEGRILVESEKGVGSTFTVELPCLPSESEA